MNKQVKKLLSEANKSSKQKEYEGAQKLIEKALKLDDSHKKASKLECFCPIFCNSRKRFKSPRFQENGGSGVDYID